MFGYEWTLCVSSLPHGTRQGLPHVHVTGQRTDVVFELLLSLLAFVLLMSQLGERRVSVALVCFLKGPCSVHYLAYKKEAHFQSFYLVINFHVFRCFLEPAIYPAQRSGGLPGRLGQGAFSCPSPAHGTRHLQVGGGPAPPCTPVPPQESEVA